MRIISGVAKGRKLKMIKGLSIRPMLDKIKGSIFNILGEKVIDANILDLYAGSGSLCMEAISRGARIGILVDISSSACRIIRENANLTEFSNMVDIIKMNMFDAIRFLGKKMNKFNIIFSDPPYNKNLCEKTLRCLASSEILDKNSIIISRHHKKEMVSEDINGLKLIDKRIYGDAIVLFLKKGGQNES